MAVDNSFWGSLILMKKSVNGDLVETNAVEQLSKDEIIIGRSKECDVAHEMNILMSGMHCRVFNKKEQKKYFLLDTSKNGTLVNSSKIKNQQVEIKDGDIIHCAHKKTRPDLDVIYRFKLESSVDLPDQEREQEEANETQEYDSEEDSLYIPEKTESRKRPTGSISSLEPECKRLQRSESSSSECIPKPSQDDCISKNDNYEDMEQNLLCGICQDIFHECVSVQPCMHSFCSACYSTWMEQSTQCPVCRKETRQVAKNHIVNNLVAAFLKTHPERKRCEKELKEMDLKDKIKNQTVEIGRHMQREIFVDVEDDNEDDYDDADSDEDDLYPDQVLQPPFPRGRTMFVIPRAPDVFSRPQGARCRQCPNFAPQNSSTQSQGSSTTGFVCSTTQNHILCYCCDEAFPDRRRETSTANNSSACSQSQSSENSKVYCTSCGKLYCHLYWGCRKPGCLGCLNKFADLNFSPTCLTRLINNNEYESNVLKNYLQQKNINIKELLRYCIQKLEANEFVVPSQPTLTRDDIVCYSCGLKYFRELSYQYRSAILASELPPEVTARSNCYWGRNCRTQVHNSAHASRFNHICEQTRFT